MIVRYYLYSGVYHLFQIYQSRVEHVGALVVGAFHLKGLETLGMVLNFIVLYLCPLLFTPPPPDEVQALVDDIRVP